MGDVANAARETERARQLVRELGPERTTQADIARVRDSQAELDRLRQSSNRNGTK